MKTKLLFWIIVMFLIIPFAFAQYSGEHQNNSLFGNATILNFDNSLPETNGTKLNTCSVVNTVTLDQNSEVVGGGSASFTGAGRISCDGTSLTGVLDEQDNYCLEYVVNTTTSSTDYVVTRMQNVGVIYWRSNIAGGVSTHFQSGSSNDFSCSSGVTVNDGLRHHIIYSIYRLAPTTWITPYVDGVKKANCSFAIGTIIQSQNLTIGGERAMNQPYTGRVGYVNLYNRSCTDSEASWLYNNSDLVQLTNISVASEVSPDTTPPIITNFSNQGSSCTNWNTDKSNPCSTSDTTPSLYFNTSENAFCAIGVSNINYTQMGSLRNCTSGEGTTEHSCDLKPQDELVYQDSIVYLSCKDSSGNGNRSDTSTSGPLSLTVTGLEASGDAAIGAGIQNSLLSSYTNYTTQQIYARNLAGQQDYGTFDWFVKKGSKAWAFNYVTKGEENILLFNLTPTLYVLEMSNITVVNITKYVETVINATK